MTIEIKESRKEIWSLLETKIPALFDESEDEEEELGADLEVCLEIGKYTGATTWLFDNDGGSLDITVYPNETVYVTLNELCHKERRIQLFENSDDDVVCINQMVMEISTLVDIFLEGNWHLLMDYMSGNVDDWRNAITEYKRVED